MTSEQEIFYQIIMDEKHGLVHILGEYPEEKRTLEIIAECLQKNSEIPDEILIKIKNNRELISITHILYIKESALLSPYYFFIEQNLKMAIQSAEDAKVYYNNSMLFKSWNEDDVCLRLQGETYREVLHRVDDWLTNNFLGKWQIMKSCIEETKHSYENWISKITFQGNNKEDLHGIFFNG